MITHKTNQLKELSIQRVSSLPQYQRHCYEYRSKISGQKQLQKRKSSPVLDSKSIKQKMAMIFKRQQLRKSQNDMYSTTYNMAKKKLRDSLRISTQKKKLRDISFRKSIHKQKMEIISTDSKQIDASAFKIAQMRIGKKKETSIPYININTSRKQNNNYRVIAMEHNRTLYDRYARKPSLPQRDYENGMNITNNFLTTKRNFKHKGNQENILQRTQVLQPWQKDEDEGGFGDFP